MTGPVRKHAHLEQAFGPLQVVEEENCRGSPPAVYDLKRDFTDTLRYYSGSILPTSSNAKSDEEYDCTRVAARDVTVNFIVPIAGRLPTLSRFLAMMERVCFASNESVTLTLMNFAMGLSSEEIGAKVKCRMSWID